MLSKQQFEGMAQELKPTGSDDAGFTVKHSTGYRPSSGHAVSLAGSERIIQTQEVTGAHLAHYAKHHERTLNERGVYLGGWAPGVGQPGHGKAAIDNTRIVKNRRKAVDEMVMQNQEAIYHLDRGETITNPYRQKPTTYHEPAGFNRKGYERDVADMYRKAKGRQSLAADEAIQSGRG